MADPIASLFIDIRAGLEKLQGDMNSAVGIVENSSKKIERVVGDIQKIFQGVLVVGGVAAVQKLGAAVVGLEQQLVSLAKKGNQAEGIARAFQMLGGSSAAIDAASEALGGLVAQGDLLRVANEGLIRGIPGINENFAQLAELGARVGVATGKSAKEGIEGLMGALESGKTKQLQAYGILVDSTKAYEAYTGGLKDAEKYLSDLDKRTAIAVAAQSQLGDALAKLPPIQDSVTVSNARMQNAFDDLLEGIGSIVDKNPQLIGGLEDFADVFNDPALIKNLKDIADTLASIVGIMTQLGSAGVSAASKAFSIFRAPSRFGAQMGEQAANWMFPNQVDQQAFGLVQSLGQRPFGAPGGASPAALAALKEQLKDAAVPEFQKRAIAAALEEQEKAASRLRDKVKAVGDEWEKIAIGGEKKGIDDQIKDAIDALDGGGFQSAIAKMGDVLDKELSEKVADAIAKGYKPTPDQIAAAKEGIDATLDQYQEQWGKASEENAKKLADDQKRAFQESVNFFGDIFDQIINGSADNLKEVFERILKQIAVGFASQLAAELTGGFSLKGGVGGIGQALASSLFGGGADILGLAGGTDIKSGAIDAAKGLAGVAEQGSAATSILNELGVSMSTVSGAAWTAAGAIGAAAVAYGTVTGVKNIADGGKLSGVQQAALALPTFGGSFAYNSVRGMFGGGRDANTNARRAVTGMLEDAHLKIFDADGQLKEVDNFLHGSKKRFQDPDWVNAFSQFDAKTQETFQGLGEALKTVAGVGEDVGAQLGLVLAEQLAGNVDNARFIVQQLGLDIGSLTDQVIEAGLAADEQLSALWAKVKGIEGLDGGGLAGKNDVAGAFSQFLGSEGKGKTPLIALQNLATESLDGITEAMKKLGLSEKDVKVLFDELEKGTYTAEQLKKFLQDTGRYGAAGIEELFTAVKEGTPTLDALKEKLVASGQFDLKDIQAFFTALQQMGVTTLQQFAEMDQKTGIGVTATAEALGLQWKQVAENIDEANSSLETFNASAANTPIPTTTTGTSGPVEAHARGGIVTSPTFFASRGRMHLMGEAGPEAILPLTRVGGRLGVMAAGGGGRGDINITVHAPNSTPGQEYAIEEAVRRGAEAALDALAQGMQSGGMRGMFGG